MTILKSFRAIRPNKGFECKIAALPYDVVNTDEAREIGDKNPYSFLHIDRAEIDLNKDINPYDLKVYDKARENLNNMINKELFIKEEKSMLYIYSLNMNGNVQTGIVGCLSIDDYMNNVIKKHEHTREEKELDRIKHVDTCSAHTGPIFLTYKHEEKLNTIIENCTKNKALYDFVAEDGIRHTVWQIDDENTIEEICHIFKAIPSVYIADGHHRAASAVKVGLKRREENKNYTGKEEFNYFLGVLFPHKELKIMDYNRVVKDTLDYTEEEFINKIEEKFIVKEYEVKVENEKTIEAYEVQNNLQDGQLENTNIEKLQYRPEEKYNFGMYYKKKWYELKAKPNTFNAEDEVESLDAAILQNNLLQPILKIQDPRKDNRIDFVGGIRGLKILEELADKTENGVAFSMYPTAIEEIIKIADNNKVMPPKSTWFEPKLRSGLFIHEI
ncbi:DUF1015 domain-containing protein [Clostridium botulinum]|uniref:DUF1015 domain-containing protein n=1 Tax=Clostridium botulinum (strain Langeland / NCTC 10281 / Type F) TaxID=441772 RepID=A7GCH0_CLOBL|nr:DUF1015 family protein [Clostridium botulinum]ABS41436.1 conserved hypothetical protein [Clostridium botulinum F str. Langeland]ADF98940.1 conserved hypothetical protein [Clostridium botulinum F str. 230613]KKM39781.1 chromosome partitioning protein ParA [Clostridium botulinum]MBY6792205.1 DUF1015 domain-containing protein [Clostridium botulinum]MBY6936214.1 DUF1015 domain-containing protein [Clostridium botulinum]